MKIDTKYIKIQTAVNFDTPREKYWEAIIFGVVMYFSRTHSHIMWGRIPYSIHFSPPTQWHI